MLTVRDVQGTVARIEELLNADGSTRDLVAAADEQRADLFQDVVQAIASGAENPLGLCAAAVGADVPERQGLALTPQAQALIAGLLADEDDVPSDDVFARDEVWAEVRAMFPPIIYRRRLNDEGQIA